jgi:hypothetical protein
LSTYWKTDDTGGKEDSSLFIKTIVKLRNDGTSVVTGVQIIEDDDKTHPLTFCAIDQVGKMEGKRKLFIFHYAGHAITGNATELLITPKISEEEIGRHLNMTLIRDSLKELAATSDGLDVLFLLDCCCSAIAGRGNVSLGQRVELMAATSPKGLSNSRQDGQTFTERWCQVFDDFLALSQPFDCNQIRDAINTSRDLEQFPAIFVLREGWGVPITFRAHPRSITLPSGPSQKIIVTAFLVNEDINSDHLKHLTEFLEASPVPITVLATLPISSTLLILGVPAYLQEMLALPRVTFITT